MKCNLSLKNQLSNKQKKELSKIISDELMIAFEQEELNCVRRVFKLIAVELNRSYGFGRKRLLKLFEKSGIQSAGNRKNDPVFWTHVDRIVNDELHLGFKSENYNELDD